MLERSHARDDRYIIIIRNKNKFSRMKQYFQFEQGYHLHPGIPEKIHSMQLSWFRQG